MPETKKLFLLDAMALIYRAYFALNKNPRINSKGLNTSAILGFALTLLDVLQNEKPTHIGVAFDTMAPTHRHDDSIAYKANRQAMPEDLAKSIPYIKQLLDAFRIPVLFCDTFEADDVIGTLAKRAEKEGFITYMMTPDKDFGQLVSDNIFIYKPARMGNKAEIMGVKEVCEKYEIERPEQVIDILGLWGDASDNIPGIPGIGEMWAKKLIAEYGSVEKVIENADSLKGKMAENVKAFAAQGMQSKMLATIILDVPVEWDVKNLELCNPDFDALNSLLNELEFKTFASRVFAIYQNKPAEKSNSVSTGQQDLFSQVVEVESTFKTINDTNPKYYLTDTAGKRAKLIEDIRTKKSFCFDTETTGLDTSNSELVGMSFSMNIGEAFYVPLPVNYAEATKIVTEFKPVFEDEEISKTGQNMKFDISMLKWYDVEVKGKLFDTMLAHYLTEPDQRHGMDFLAETYLGYKPISFDELIGKKAGKQPDMRHVQETRLNDVVNYAAEDADITLQLREKLEPFLIQNKTMPLFEEIEMPLVPVLASMEAEGVKLDVKALNDYSAQLLEEIINVEKEIYDLAGGEFNISSPKQLGVILFDRLKIADNPKKTKTKQYSTGEDILSKLEKKHPIVSKILDYRSLTKLKSTYVDALPLLVNPRDGRIHTSYNQAVAATGRLSSTNPNLQNIPIRTEKGREIRKSFVPRSDEFTLLSADYSQIELRIIAELSEDPAMMEAFRSGLDIHTATAAKVYGAELDEITKDMRRNAKAVNFGIVYGISAFGLSEQLNIPRSEAYEMIANYFEEYAGIKRFMDQTIRFARENGFVTTIKGRRRYLRDINSSNATVRGFAERNAINAPIQGSSADMIKIAMINIHNEIIRRKLKTRMILQVHDELVFDVFKDELAEVKILVEDKMKHAIEMKVPVLVDMNNGNTWLEAH